MKITVLYFAAVRDLVGADTEDVDLPADAITVGAVAKVLADRHPRLAVHLGSVRFARNEDFAHDADPIEAGDVIALIPPVCGG
jgi:molybdopterin converting factor subunit 1